MDRPAFAPGAAAQGAPGVAPGRPVLPAAARVRARAAGHRAALPRRRAGLSRAGTAAGHRHPASVPDHRPERQAGGGGDHGDRSRRGRARAAVPAAVVPVRDRRGGVPLLSVLRAAALREGDRSVGATGVFADHGGPGRGLGGVGARSRRPSRHVGRALPTWLLHSRRGPRRARLGAHRAVAVGTGGAVGLLRRGAGHRVGDLAHTFRRLNGGPLAGLPALVIAALAHVYPDLDRVIKTHTNEAGRALLCELEDMTTVGAVIRMAGRNVSKYLDRPLEEILE